MGLFDSVIGAVSSQLQSGEGLQGLAGMLGAKPELLQAAASLLGNDGGVGGLQGLIAKFQQGGLGDVVASWVGTGANLPVSPEQISSVLGNDTLTSMASKFGVDGGDFAAQLSSVLPGLVDKLTPNGQAPAAGLGDASDLAGMLGGLLKG